MKKTLFINIALLVILSLFIVVLLGCDAVRGGAEVWLEDITIGSFTMDGKPIAGLPTNKIDAVLKVSTNKVYIKSTSDGFIIRLSPSNAVITTSTNGLSITGVDPEKIELKLDTGTTK